MSRKINITYDATNGIPVRDGDTHKIVEEFASSMKEVNFVAGTENIIDRLRVAVKDKIINPEDITIFFKETVITVYDNGRLSSFPEGFCCHTEDCLMRL